MDARRTLVLQLNDRQRQMDGKSRALAFALASSLYRATVQFHELFADRQPEPQTTKGSRGRAVFLREPIEDMRKIIRGNANAGVADAQFEVRIHTLEQDLYLTAFRSELDRIGQQVPHDLLQAAAVGADYVLACTKDCPHSNALGLRRGHRRVNSGFYNARKRDLVQV